MGKHAAAAYLWRMRDHRGLSRVQVAEYAGITDQSIYRIELGTQEPKAQILMLIIERLNADPVDIYELLIDPNDSPEIGVLRANKQYLRETQERYTEEIQSLAEQIADVQRQLNEVRQGQQGHSGSNGFIGGTRQQGQDVPVGSAQDALRAALLSRFPDAPITLDLLVLDIRDVQQLQQIHADLPTIPDLVTLEQRLRRAASSQ